MHRGFSLPVSRVIHAVGPIYDTDSNPEASLSSAYRCLLVYLADVIASRIICVFRNDFSFLCAQFDYRNSLRVAKENDIQYVAFPAISCGIYG